jgi:hypothetical protein
MELLPVSSGTKAATVFELRVVMNPKRDTLEESIVIVQRRVDDLRVAILHGGGMAGDVCDASKRMKGAAQRVFFSFWRYEQEEDNC